MNLSVDDGPNSEFMPCFHTSEAIINAKLT